MSARADPDPQEAPVPSPFAADRLPDGSRRYGHRAVLARRALLAGIVAAGAGTAALTARPGGGERAPAGADPAVHDPVLQAPVAAGGPVEPPPGFSTSDPASPWVVVNKRHPVTPPDFVPPALATVGGKEVAALVAPDLTALLAAAGAEGVRLTLTSGYRSAGHQRAVHERAVRRDGAETAESLSARPGHSEHQTGLAIDFGSAVQPGCAVEDCFGLTDEARWLAERAGAFGFLQRYTARNSPVTGYAPESWHYRWVGADLVARMAERGVSTLEEFFGVTGGPRYA
ncbi:M15 family metallopeptidase [Kineococcus indalonis]|uniref:M15 family metallopeptidase n=1 Tax=Kineococcus indalonis TaxID=2696566 RepID=UPI0014133015|nr:M15 family metallopeptidase [Kineococcus indalonis]NAZ86479.1 D-alanyl-D-alanine carboxypeptidase family protein [Kineococcus indalonis]